MIRVAVIFTLIISVFLGCKSSKNASKYISPHTDTIKVKVNYSLDSVELYVKRIIENDSLFKLKENGAKYTVIAAQQKDSSMYVTVKSFNGCANMDFDLYQSSFIFKSYPPRIRVRLAKTNEGDCDAENPSRMQMHTVVFDIRDILNQYNQAVVSFTGSRATAVLKK